jgi:SNF2 family DNA or RNA helicase
MLRRLAKDELDLKEPITMTRWVTLHPDQEKLYRDVLENIYEDGEGEEQIIENALVRFLRLKQVCATTKGILKHDSSAILDRAIEDLEEITANNYKAVVFTQFKDALHSCEERLKEKGIVYWELSGDIPMEDRLPIVKAWAADPRPGVLVCMMQVAREGLSMVAAKYGLFLDKLFVPGLNEQCVRRLNRIGQDTIRPVTIIDYKPKLSDGEKTVVARVDQILATKVKTNDIVIEGSNQWKQKVDAILREALGK